MGPWSQVSGPSFHLAIDVSNWRKRSLAGQSLPFRMSSHGGLGPSTPSRRWVEAVTGLPSGDGLLEQ